MRHIAACLGIAVGFATLGSAQTDLSKALVGNEYHTLRAYFAKSETLKLLQGKGPYTLFAPTDAAFAKLPERLRAGIDANPRLRDAILSNLVCPGKLYVGTLKKPTLLKSVKGDTYAVRRIGSDTWVNGSQVVRADIKAKNGVAHGIDSVPLPARVTQAMRGPNTAPAGRPRK